MVLTSRATILVYLNHGVALGGLVRDVGVQDGGSGPRRGPGGSPEGRRGRGRQLAAGGCWGWGDGGDSLASSGGGDLERRAREGIRKPEAGAWPRRRGRPISHQLAAGPTRRPALTSWQRGPGRS
jgi:hypothetical protein